MNKDFLTRQEVARLLNVSTRTVSRKVKSGKILAVRHKGKLRFPVSQFEDVKTAQKESKHLLLDTLQKQIEEKDIQIRKLQEDTTIKALQEQLKEKDKQIERLQIALNNQQGLTKDITEKILYLPRPEEKQEVVVKESKKHQKKTKKKGNKKQGLLRLFRKSN